MNDKLRQSVGQWRKRLGSVAIDGFFEGAARIGKMHPLARPESHGVTVKRNVPYGPSGGPQHLMDIYLPRDRSRPVPTVLYIHGGGFRILSKDTHWVMGLMFARAGMAVFNINYRLAPKHPFPAAFEDCAQAYEWVLEHAESYGADLDRLVLAGESAGANLVTSLTLATCFDRPEPFAKPLFDRGHVPRVVVPFCGVFQVSDLVRLARRRPDMPSFIVDRLTEVSEAYLGAQPGTHGEKLDLADPVCWLEKAGEPERPLPPCFLPVGTKDPVLDDSRRLHEAWKAHGGQSSLAVYPGEVHAFHAFVWRAEAQRCWRDALGFIDGHLPNWSPAI